MLFFTNEIVTNSVFLVKHICKSLSFFINKTLLFTLIMCVLSVLYNHLDFGSKKNAAIYKTLNITIPEDLDYTGVFEAILQKYTTSCELVRVKTTNMGSMFRLTYNLTLRDAEKEKEMIGIGIRD